MDGPATILVVSNPSDTAEIRAALGDAVLPGARIVVDDGADGTLGTFVEQRPEVVVMTATLDAGDGRSLIGAMRDAAAAGTFHVVLIGDLRGPVRNALDAADFRADRFVARPLAAKALRYAVTTGAAVARRARAAGAAAPSAAPVAVLPEAGSTRVSGQHRAVLVTGAGTEPGVGAMRRPRTVSDRFEAMLDEEIEHHVEDEVVRRTSGGFSVPVEAILAAGGEVDPAVAAAVVDGAVTAPMAAGELPTRPVSSFEARQHLLVDATAGAAAPAPAAAWRRGRTIRRRRRAQP
ncbi:MAG: hypothetical protein H6709_21600 [Kofleriaceae bacterium]|nr:hypothetical protein [Kofleriaceae bacterium]